MPSAGTKSEVATSNVPSRGPKRERNCYVTLAFSGVPYTKRRGKLKFGHLTRAFSRVQKRAELLRNPYILGDPHCQAQGQNQKWPPHTCLLGGPKKSRIVT